jgi:hypothetical protein
MVDRVVELRVHGVSGTPPEELLDRPLVRQVAGDATAGFYRPRLPAEILDEPFRDPRVGDGAAAPDVTGAAPGAYLEGYAWGGLTSGAPSRGLWLLLLPFALVNVAPRLRPAAGSERATAVLLTAARLLALASTATLTLGAATVGLDLLAWQCGGPAVASCRGLPEGPRLWFAGLPVGTRLLLGAVVPVLVLGLLWFVTRRSAERYEAVADTPPGPAPAEPGTGDPDALDPPLADRWTWRGRYLARRLRHLHLQGALLVLVLTGSAALRPGPGATTVAVLAAAGLGVVAVALGTRRVVGRSREPTLLARAGWVPAVAGAALLAGLLLAGNARPEPPPAARVPLPGTDAALTTAVAVQLVLVLVMAVAAARMRRAETPPRSALYGAGAPLLAAAGVLVGAAFTAGVVVYAASFLVTGVVTPGPGAVAQGWLVIPTILRVTAVAFAWTVIGLVVLAVVVVVRIATGWRVPGTANLLAAAHPGADGATARAAAVRRVLWQARLADAGGPLAAALLAFLTAVSVGVTVLTVAAAAGQPDAARVVAAAVRPGWPYQLGSIVAGALPVGLALLASAVFRVGRTRRSVGILWDLASFWPRSVHPLAPPCYAERTVPDLKHRIRWLVRDRDPGAAGYPHGSVVLAGHSQGSVITAAALLQMGADPRDRDVVGRVAFLSYGCVLRRLYSRYFPYHLGPDRLAPLHTGRWLNLWRATDYLGGPVEFVLPPLRATTAEVAREVLAGRCVDRRLTDPPYDPPPGDLGAPAAHRHSGFPLDPRFQEAVAELARTLPR